TKYGETMQFMTLEDEWGFVDVTFFPSPNRERLSEGDRAAHAARSPHDIDLASGGRQPSGAASGGRQPSGPPFPSATYLGMGPYLVWGTVEEQYGVITVTAQRFIKQPISPWPEET
ncbi:MAG: hypothetical protein NZM31_00255, partial [Gemmatales bacterium]|nr:hypothetical protein [Gemmatales bacterium]MDW8385424.1 hypothetical protein [Gemmatales bacterium]